VETRVHGECTSKSEHADLWKTSPSPPLGGALSVRVEALVSSLFQLVSSNARPIALLAGVTVTAIRACRWVSYRIQDLPSTKALDLG
jgi:hypothetical protein